MSRLDSQDKLLIDAGIYEDVEIKNQIKKY